MDDVTRRDAIKAAATAGAVLVGAAAVGAQDKKDGKNGPVSKKKGGPFVHSVTFGTHTLKIAYLDGTCYPIPYDSDVGYGFSLEGTVWVCDPLDDSYTDGKIKYLGATIATYHLDKNGVEVSSTVAGVAKFKARLNIGGRKFEFMRCPYNGDIFHPGYDCPDDWVRLVSW